MQINHSQSAIDGARELVQVEFLKLNQTIKNRLPAPVALINQVGEHIIASGGKRLRPLLTLLAAKLCGSAGESDILAATIIEFLHTATLLHDDVVDHSQLRRGKPTANNIWGNEASVLVGDYLYSRSFEMMSELKNLEIFSMLATATNIIAAGEVEQLANRYHSNLSEANYRRVIYAKTAKLFEVACQLGAMIASKNPETIQALKTYGLHFGMCFQLVDDALDYTGDAAQMGKNIGDDLAEGKTTLPLIIAMQHASETDKKLIAESIQSGSLKNIHAIQAILKTTHAIEKTLATAKVEAQLAIKALTVFQDSRFKIALEDLAQFAINRDF